MQRPGILIVSASTGTGHLRAAEALREALAQRDPALPVEHVDLLDTAPRWVRAAYGAGYEMVAAKAPRVWGHVYRLSDGDAADRPHWAPFAHRFLFREFRRLLLSRPWALCLGTHFLPCQLAAGRAGLPPFALAITDFTLHRFWVQPGVRRYFVATDELAEELRGRVRGARIETTGIPIAPGFAEVPGREEARAALGLDLRRPVALVMGGGLGLGVEEAARAALAATDNAVQVAAVCARNEGARERLAALGLPEGRLRVMGYERGIERWISAADVVATKPGGLTTSETLALGRPLVLTRPIPGAEEGNTRALVAAGAALAGQDPASLRGAFGRLFGGEPGLLERLAGGARRIGRPDAAMAVACAVQREYLSGAGQGAVAA
jgi:processive 1,2-diacylglycerol beta-glucosyltransferase